MECSRKRKTSKCLVRKLKHLLITSYNHGFDYSIINGKLVANVRLSYLVEWYNDCTNTNFVRKIKQWYKNEIASAYVFFQDLFPSDTLIWSDWRHFTVCREIGTRAEAATGGDP